MAEKLLRETVDLDTYDGQQVTVVGHYRSVVRPRKGPPAENGEKECAVVVLADGAEVFLEALDSPAAVRPRSERRQFDGKQICATGTAHKIMPSRGQGLLAPCLSGVGQIREHSN